MPARPIIVWFRDDLRLSDNPALHAAVKAGAPLICLHVLDETVGRRVGGASRWWLAQSLRSLATDIAARGAKLTLRKGSALKVIVDLARAVDAQAVHWNEIAQAPWLAADAKLKASLEKHGVTVEIFPGDLLASPSAIRNKDGRGLRVFTPFWRRVLALGDPPKPLPSPKRLPSGPTIESETLESYDLEPTRPDWAGGLRATWRPGETQARERLRHFLKAAARDYASGRDRPDRPGTSGLSPHLRFGEISPRQVWHTSRFAADADPALAPGVEKALSELGWREFCRHLLFDHPDLATRNLQQGFDAFPWTHDAKALAAWQRGRTGYPIVDAGMRELWYSGVMHNRVRMVAASFLVKHLLIDWRDGERWFWDTLVDADPASNPANWQWVAGCGADAAPYFRVFNPVLQGEKFDPDGIYVKRWLPELEGLPPKLIHKPWQATPIELASAGIELGRNYPRPIVDHATARARALSAYAEIRKN
jgi:deoxyribodipyrimidine photo-lyase